MEKVIKFKLTGISPLLQHNPISMQTSGKPGKKRIPKPEEEALMGMYLNDDGQVYHPGEAFRNALLYAAKGQKAGKIALASIVSGAVFNMIDRVLVINPETNEPLRKYDEIDTRRAVVQRQGVMRSRPKYNFWGVNVEFEYDPEYIDPDVIEGLMTRAGKICGVGDFRPEKKGTFGRFKVEGIE